MNTNKEKREKFLLLTPQEKATVIKLFPKDDGSQMTKRALWNILHYRVNSELATQVRHYITESLKVKPRFKTL